MEWLDEGQGGMEGEETEGELNVTYERKLLLQDQDEETRHWHLALQFLHEKNILQGLDLQHHGL